MSLLVPLPLDVGDRCRCGDHAPLVALRSAPYALDVAKAQADAARLLDGRWRISTSFRCRATCRACWTRGAS